MKRALSYMDLDGSAEGEGECVQPKSTWCKKPRAADQIEAALKDQPMRVVPPTTVFQPRYLVHFALITVHLLPCRHYVQLICTVDVLIISVYFCAIYGYSPILLILPSLRSDLEVKQNAKAAKEADERADPELRCDSFHGQLLDDLPMEARPFKDKEYKGRKGYTIHSDRGAVT